MLPSPGHPPHSLSPRFLLLIIPALLLLTAAVELSMGRRIISQSQQVHLWAAANSPELSQQIADAYSFSHLLHGIILYALLRLISRRRWSAAFCLALAVGAECGWEILENTPLVIGRYRHSGLAADYDGDTLLNSLCDILFCIAGFLLAARFPAWCSIAIILIVEIALPLIIRDNLILNITNLVHPFDFIQRWQLGRGF